MLANFSKVKNQLKQNVFRVPSLNNLATALAPKTLTQVLIQTGEQICVTKVIHPKYYKHLKEAAVTQSFGQKKMGWFSGRLAFFKLQAESNKESRKLTPTVKDLLFLACVAFCVITFEPIMI